jgi:hypothetical protein
MLGRVLLMAKRPLAILALLAPIVSATAQEASSGAVYCLDLKRLAMLALENQFATIAGKPREGSFRDTTLPLMGWKDCALYGATTYTCDSHELKTSQEAEDTLAKTTDQILRCLAGAWVEIKDRSSPAYVVLHPARGAASITLSIDENEKKEYLVRLTLFLRGRQVRA